MEKMFFGMIFVVINYTLTLGNMRIELVPQFLGYIGLTLGFSELADINPGFLRLRPFAIGMAVFTGAVFAFQLVGFVEQWAYFVLLAALLLSSAAKFILLYRVIDCIRELELMIETSLDSDRLIHSWRILLAANIAVYLLLFVPFLALIGFAAAFASGVYFLVRFYKTKQRYERRDEEGFYL